MSILPLSDKDIKRFWGHVDIRGPNDCWEWKMGLNHAGYGQFSTPKRPQLAHRVAYAIITGGDPVGKCVLHRCDNPVCVNFNHLFIGTRQENMQDMMNKSRQCFGERQGRSKLTWEQVKEIRYRYPREGKSQAELAKEYGISPPIISEIMSNKIWKKEFAP